ncbi:hypothetical protein [Candidatus Desulfofervidus auxilii]|nr:hypothetical protein [Candidatus Desulfofervidus auxilii]
MKTHTGALRPGNYSILIAKCTSPDKSYYPEQVEGKLAKFIGSRSIAKYVVLIATTKNRGFGFLLDNMTWSWKGHVINAVLKYLGKFSEDKNVYFNLSQLEKIAYLKYFLETEGALILKFSEKFADKKEITYSHLKNEIQNIFEEIYEGYIDIAPDFRIRMKIKEMFKEMQRRMKNKKHVYDKSTLPHKIKPHLQALCDLGLLEVKNENTEEIYKVVIHNKINPLESLYKELKNFKQLEESIENNNFFPIIGKILGLNPTKYSIKQHEELLKETFLLGYRSMKNVVGLADISALVDWCCIKLLSEKNILIYPQDVQEFLDKIRKYNPSSIRYHVNGKGRISYIIWDETFN